MRAAMFYEPGDVRMEDVPAPEHGPGEVLVRVGVALTCGTDVKTYRRGHPTLFEPLPSPFGHELAGNIETVGEGVEGWQAGMRVVAANSAPCNRCYLLQGRRPVHVREPGVLERGVRRVHRGAEEDCGAEPVRDPRRHRVRPGGAAGATGLRGTRRRVYAHRDGRRGGGHRGRPDRTDVRPARHRARRAICVDRSKDRLAVAHELGAEETVEAVEGVEAVEAVRGWTPEGRGADVVIEAVRLPELWEQVLLMARKGGDVTLFGGAPSGTKMEVDTVRLRYSQLTIRGIFHHTPYTAQVAFELLKSGRVDPEEPFISGVRPLEHVLEALQAPGRQQGIKCEIRP